MNRRKGQGITKADLATLHRISRGEDVPGAVRFLRVFRRKLMTQLGPPPQPQRRQVRAEAAPWIAGDLAQRAKRPLQPPPAAHFSRRT